MRIDRFLKVSRLIRRRSVAKQVAEQGRIKINDQVAKPSSRVAVGDIVEVQYGHRIVTVKINELLESTKKADAENMYEIIKTEAIEHPLSDD